MATDGRSAKSSGPGKHGEERALIRVALPSNMPAEWQPLFRSGHRVWSELETHLSGDGVEIVHDSPDVEVWDPFRPPIGGGAPLVALLHEAPTEDDQLDPDLLRHLDEVGALAARSAVRFVTCSQASRSSIAHRYGVSPSKIDVVGYGVDHQVFTPNGPTGVETVRLAGGTADPYILFVGSVIPRKNLAVLREAMASLPSHQLVVVASPALDSESPRLLEQAVAPINGRLVPNLQGIDDTQLAALMRGAAALCLPSLSEGFGLPPLEAMACGTPVVVSDRGSLPEVVGEAGVIVPPSVQAVRDGLKTAISNRALFRQLGLRRSAQFTWPRTAEAVREILRGVIVQRSVSGPYA
jgi:glycosyltransferase involved in cell wall biosynthesis